MFWWDPTSIRAFSYRDTLNAQGPAALFFPGFSVHLTRAPDLMFALIGLYALLVELSYGLVLVSPLARRILPTAAFLMHIGIFVFQKLLFYDLVLVQLIFLDAMKVRDALMRGLVGATKGQVAYDGGPDCGIAPTNHAVAVQEAARQRLAWPLAVSGLMAVLLISWVHRVEFYPITTWTMYASRASEAVYTHVYARYEFGAVSRVYFADAIGALTGNRARIYLRTCFIPDDRLRCERFLGAVAAAYNRRPPSAGRVTQFEIKNWSWDFRAYPSEPGRAALTGHFLFDPARNASARR